MEEKPQANSECKLPVTAFPEGNIREEGFVIFQCHGKKINFFMMMLMAQIILLGN